MRVHARLYAGLARLLADVESGVPFEVKLAEGATVGDLLLQLRLSQKTVKLTFVNGRSRPAEHLLEDGDEVGLFPPVGGG
jgi:molybdopterin synthase sulfur carrier subunit